MSEVDNLVDAFEKSDNMRTTDITLLGNRNTIVQIISLLSQIRTAINSNSKCSINLKIGNNVVNSDFEFLVNNSKIDDSRIKDVVEIN